ncbi:SUKH-4 family immunity protein [Ruminiclostridium josui]|jgi:hypothetical protein|uniref:SUKH-4 family immunity protein n=1 Tax=Ruminiclostridium josui TaxID=1499 RepID=UPI0004674E31|nr:SUKH-4 family immunity protein [Ruminiclostridium josui]
MDKESITEFWNDSLVRFNMELLSKCSLTQETKEFLELFGLPVNCEFLKDLNISFYNIFEQISIKGCNYIAIGDDYGTKICIRENLNEIISVDIERDMNIRIINSSIEHFINFLQIYFTRRPELSKADDEEAVEIVRSMRDDFDKLDAMALSNEENWWAVILEQTEQGLL